MIDGCFCDGVWCVLWCVCGVDDVNEGVMCVMWCWCWCGVCECWECVFLRRVGDGVYVVFV